MSDEKPKPFAVALPAGARVAGGSGFEVPGISIDGGDPWRGPERFIDAQNLANVVAGVVEQREANLRGKLEAALSTMTYADTVLENDPACLAESERARQMLSYTKGLVHDALGPNPPQYVRAELLAAEQAKLKAFQVAFDALEGARREHIAPFLIAHGAIPAAVMTDDELEAEMRKRGYSLMRVSAAHLYTTIDSSTG